MLDGMGELPPGWEIVQLGEILPPPRSKIAADAQSDLAYVGLENISANGLQPSSFGRFADMRSAGSQFQAGDVLYGRLRPYLNKVWCADRTGAASAEFIVFPSNQVIDGRFLALLLHHSRFVTFASHAVSGDRPRIDVSDMAPYAVALPPLVEQLRIVKAVDSLFTELDEAEAALTRAQASLADYRASLLHAACIGQLTAAWRASRPHPAEDGPALLRRILAKRQAAWERAELARLHTRGKPPAGDAWKARYQEPTGADTDGLLTLPDGWTWASLEQLCSIVGGITVDAKRTGIGLAAVPYLRVANVQRGRLDLSQVKMLQAPSDRIEALRLVPNDVLLNEGGDRDKVGRGWVWAGELPLCIHQNHIFRARPCLPEMDGRFISHCLNEIGRAYFLDAAIQTTNLASISMAKVSRVPIPVPPLEELRQIVKLIASGLEDAEAGNALVADIATLRQSILHAAFTGRLVPQDPTDEPAAVLLARLRDAPVSPRRTRKQDRAA